MGTYGFGDWIETMRGDIHGPGVRMAFECGARARLRGERQALYRRADCRREYSRGWELMDKTLKNGHIVVCDCCRARIDKNGPIRVRA